MRLRVVTSKDDGAVPAGHIGIIAGSELVALFNMQNDSLAYTLFMKGVMNSGHSIWHDGVCIAGSIEEMTA